METICSDLFLFRDTCNVYILRQGASAVLVDFGSGDVLDHLAEIGVERVTDVLMTHHHRDQGQGLPRALRAGAAIWVPHAEQDLFTHIDAHWQGREVFNNYNTRQDRFSLLEPARAAGTLRDYETRQFGKYDITILPTPGHTTGSLSLMLVLEGQRIFFTGDLIYAPGKVWSMAATQWTYNGAEGAAASIASLLDLKDRQPHKLLPSHGNPQDDPLPGIDLLVERLWELLQRRHQNPRLFQLRSQPYEIITPHLLKHRASMANTYVLLSESGKALFIDFGYDFITGIPAGSDRASRRPWLYTLPSLKGQFGVKHIDAVIPTHYHDDHVAGCNLLREVEGAQVWAAENFASILERPSDYDLPCLWYDPIPVDRCLPLCEPLPWEEYIFTLYPLPGHTLHAVVVEFQVDGQRVLATGDQYQGDDGLLWNYVYQNRYHVGDYAASARLYRRICPDLILPGHWNPLKVTPEYLDALEETSQALERLHQDLLPQGIGLGVEGCLARIQPYQARACWGEPLPFTVEVTNPFSEPQQARLEVIAPQSWIIEPASQTFSIVKTQILSFCVTPLGSQPARRMRLAVDLTIGSQRFGQQAEALVSVESGPEGLAR